MVRKLQSTSASSLLPSNKLSSSAKSIRKRKLTDKTIPNVILQNPDFAQDSQMYQDLLEMERRLDWTMMRKKVEVQDALTRNPTVACYVVILCWRVSDGSGQTTRTLRIFLSHTVSGQLWQTGGDVVANFETGEGIPAWTFKIEGRMLEVRLAFLDTLF